MAKIAIYDLKPAGADLLFDDESYMNNLSEEELHISGGGTPTLTTTAVCASSPACMASAAVATLIISGVAAYTYYH